MKKKPYLVLWIIAAIFLVCSIPLFASDFTSGVIGVLISAALGFFGWRSFDKKRKLQSAAEKAHFDSIERQRQYDEKHGTIETSVAGVTFDNEDGTSRQYALKMLKGKEKRGEYYEVRLVPYTFKDRPAIYVYADDRCVGNVKTEDTHEVMSIIDRLDFVELDPYSFKNEKNRIIYASSMVIHYFKQ